MHVTYAFRELTAVEDCGQIDIGSAEHEPRRHHSDNCPRGPVEEHLPSEHGGIGAELAIPELVSQDRDRWNPCHGIRWRRSAPDERGHAHHVKGVHGADIATKAPRLTLTAPQDVTDGGGNHTIKNGIALGN